MSVGAALVARDVTVRFGGNVALNNVTIDAQPGQVTGLIGPNGAGKTTLFNVITGLQPATSGAVLLDDEDITRLDTFKHARRGIGRTFQRLELFTGLSVRDNIRVAGEIRNSWRLLPSRSGRLDGNARPTASSTCSGCEPSRTWTSRPCRPVLPVWWSSDVPS